MTPSRVLSRHRLDLALLRCASALVPAAQRRDWLAEWRAELWYASRQGSATAFCLGAFNDALWLRRQGLGRATLRLESARRCGLVLALILGAALTLAVRLPGARERLLPRAESHPAGLVTIAREGLADPSKPSISAAEYASWRHRRQTLFSGFAFYRMLPAGPSSASDGRAGRPVLLASASLIDLLHIPVDTAALAQAQREHRTPYLLTHAIWRADFHADPHAAGRSVDLAGRHAMIVGVLPETTWQPAPSLAGWLLEEPAASSSNIPGSGLGFALGQTSKPLASTLPAGHWRMDVASAGTVAGFSCDPLGSGETHPFATFLYTLLLACLALPATTPLPLGDYPAVDPQHSSTTRLRRWLFLLAKLSLVVPIVYAASLDVAFFDTSFRATTSEYLQFASSFAGLLFGFRWALRDQRRRCPVCLRTLTHPARVGHASRNFLAWHGTEFICGEGHGLLHVPEIATTWFSTQRWLYLDPSWQGLFPAVSLPTASTFSG